VSLHSSPDLLLLRDPNRLFFISDSFERIYLKLEFPKLRIFGADVRRCSLFSSAAGISVESPRELLLRSAE
jgi:hypothetical protein